MKHSTYCPLLLIPILVGLSPTLAAQSIDPNHPGILGPVLSELEGIPVRIPHTDQATGSQQNNLVGPVVSNDAHGELSLLGHPITEVRSPNDAMRDALRELSIAAGNGDQPGMQAAASELESILLGTTEGRIYDGFPMLNYNQSIAAPGQVPGEYKMKILTDTGLTEPGLGGGFGTPRKIWEMDVNYLWYDGQFDSDTFLFKVPIGAHPLDTMRINYKIYSLVYEEFSPTTVMLDFRYTGGVNMPFKGFDSVWQAIDRDSVTELTVAHPPVGMTRGVYNWGWTVHPPRIQFLQPVYEMVNGHTGALQLEPQGFSFKERNRTLSIDGIGTAAPEKKMYQVVQAVLLGAGAGDIHAMLNEENSGPRGTWQQWCHLAKYQRQLPPEARDILTSEGIGAGTFGPYDFVTVYLNNEMYGAGPEGEFIEGWNQGDRKNVKVINLDRHSHYYRVVDFGPKLHDDIVNGFSAGSESFEIMNFKPAYGAPKVAEMQWRAGWGFRPHLDVVQQPDVFPRLGDQRKLTAFSDGSGRRRMGYKFADVAGGEFRFNPPGFIIGSVATPSAFGLKEADGSPGLAIGQLTEGYGIAKMCSHRNHPLGGFCGRDLAPYNPWGVYNRDTDGDGVDDELWFPPFLRNPNLREGGDIIPPTRAWKPFLWINPNNGTLFIDPANPDAGYWADLTYSHGRPIPSETSVNVTIEMPRAGGQLFYQFDDLFHDNSIFSPHPTFAEPVQGG
jgi:hypothetical protein